MIAAISNPPTTSILLLTLCLVSWPTASRGQQLSREELEELTEQQFDAAIELYREFLSLPNDAHFPDDMRVIVDWLDSAFRLRGFATRELSTAGLPLLLATREFPGAERTVLFYLQSDGQPVSPEHWRQDDPYAPVLKEQSRTGEDNIIPWARLDTERDLDWRVFARSASDSKGPVTQFLSALDAMDRHGFSPDFNIKVIVDTEEELGSPNLPKAVERYRTELAADMLVILDGPPHISNGPTLKFGARGIATFTLTTYGPYVPLHSGHYGNYAPNPAMRLAQILASMKDEKGRVTIPGFYDGIELDESTKAILEGVPDDEAQIHRRLGISTIDDVGTTLQEAVQYPSLNVRGVSSGWVGDQRRTIIPATAIAEVDVRLVMESDPERLLGLIRAHIQGLGYHLTEGPPSDDERRRYSKIAGFTSEISYLAFRTDFDSEPGRWLRRAYEHLYGEPPIMIRTSGGSIPISPFVTTLDIPAVGVPTVNSDNNQHSPNENLRLGNFIEGITVILSILAQNLEQQTGA